MEAKDIKSLEEKKGLTPQMEASIEAKKQTLSNEKMVKK